MNAPVDEIINNIANIIPIKIEGTSKDNKMNIFYTCEYAVSGSPVVILLNSGRVISAPVTTIGDSLEKLPSNLKHVRFEACEHDFDVTVMQVRSGDEGETTFRKCKKCLFVIKED